MISIGNKGVSLIKTVDSWGSIQIGTLLLTLVIIAATWTFTLQRLQHEEKLVIEHALAAQRTLNIIISENLTQVLNRSQIYRIGAAQWLNEDKAQAETRFAGMLASDAVFSRIALFDANGHTLFASSPSMQDQAIQPAIGPLLARYGKQQTSDLTVGPLSHALGESWQVPLLFPVPSQDGRPAAVMLLVLDLGYVLRLYQNIDIGRTGTIHVLMQDGREIVRARRGGLELSNPPSGDGLTQAVLPLKQRPPGSIALPDGHYLTSSFHLEHHPFVIVINQETDDVLQNFDSIKRKQLLTVAFLTLIVLGSALWITAMMRRQQRVFDTLTASEDEKRELIVRLNDEKRRALALASQDHLTGLANRRMFMELASNHLAHSKRSRLHSALLFIDLNRFKAINDTLGHHVGDLLLQTVASRLRGLLRESDIIARFGGDEFVLLLTGLEHEEDTAGIAQKIVECISQPCQNLDGHDLQISPSIGIAIYPRDGQELDDLIHNADLAMYQSKQSKTGSFTFFDASLNVRDVLQFELAQRFTRAIKDDEFVLHFQPKVELANYRINGLEALVRWQHPEHGLIFPGDFVPLAEHTGHIVELGNWVIEAACRQLAAWKRQGLPVVRVAVNVSASQLRDDALVAHILDSLQRHDLGSELIELEITESSLVENFDVAGDILNQIVAAGIKVALDDFGNGFSSLGYIKTLPIDTIKIDRAFICDIRNSHDDAVIVDSTITLAHNLGMRVVAEGIETREQLVHLKTAGCDEVQGYYFSRPVTPDKIEALLLKQDTAAQMKNNHSLKVALAALLLAATLPARAAGCDDPKPLRFSLIPKKSMVEQLEHYRPLLALLEKKLGRKIETFQPTSYSSVIEGLLSGSIDMAELGAASYALAKNRAPNAIQAFATHYGIRGPHTEEGKYYHSLLIVKKNSLYADIAALAGSNVNLTDPASTSGAIVPRRQFAAAVEMPFERYFSHVLYAGSHDTAAQSVYNRFADAAFVSSKVLDEALQNRKYAPDDFRVLWTSPSIPNEPIVYRSALCEPVKAGIREVYFGGSPELAPVLAKLKARKFIPASDEDYLAIREMVKEQPASQ